MSGGKAASEPHYAGHRDRLRDRFRKTGGESFEDYELLELLLFSVIPQKDTKPLAKTLLDRFGTFSEVLAATEAELASVKGIGKTAATQLKAIEAAARRFAKDKVQKSAVFATSGAVIDYCRKAMALERKEIFRILFLDKRNGLIADEVQQTGTVDHTPVYPREVVKRALELSSTALILVHNHPSGDPTPSRDDIEMTRRIVDIAKPLGIVVHDHLIVGRGGHKSLKEMGLI